MSKYMPGSWRLLPIGTALGMAVVKSASPQQPGCDCKRCSQQLQFFRHVVGKRSISGLKIEELTVGTGPEAVKGKTVTIQAIGRLNKGDMFCSTHLYGQPWKFKAGGHKAIAGLSKGVLGMRVGGKRRIRVSPHLGYRDQSIPANGLFQLPIPPNSVLVFEIELLSVEDL
jgi:FKBP-type peptidyl-prolyl cis-trans isomerase FkpA